MTIQANDQIRIIFNEELSDLNFIAQVLTANLHRSLRLLHQSRKTEENTDDKKIYLEYMYDIARATTVFLHASLETTLREIVRLILKYDRAADVSYISLTEQSRNPSRKEKFTLQDLVKHRGRVVDEVIDESIDAYLSILSFNNTKDIADTFERLRLPQSTLREYYSQLDDMIKRRHQIVHEADLKRGRLLTEPEPIEIEQLKNWIDTTAEFCTEVIRLTKDAVYVEKIVEHLSKNGFLLSRDEVAQMIVIKVEDKY